jgi:hypothetical protein
MRPIEFVYSINGTALERVDENKDLGVIMDGKRVWPLPVYDARCLLIGLEMLSDRRIIASALFARVIQTNDCIPKNEQMKQIQSHNNNLKMICYDFNLKSEQDLKSHYKCRSI